MIGGEQVEDECIVNQNPLEGVGISPRAQVLVSAKLVPPPEGVQPGVNPEQEEVGEKKVLVKPCSEEQVLSEKQHVPELYALKDGSKGGEGAQFCDGEWVGEGA